jgi:hypothetical protein
MLVSKSDILALEQKIASRKLLDLLYFEKKKHVSTDMLGDRVHL